MNDKHISLMFSEEQARRIVSKIREEFDLSLDEGEMLSIRDAIYRAGISASVRSGRDD